MDGDTTMESKAEEISMMPIDQIKPHPKNTDIYGKDGSILPLAKSIASCGVREPLVVTSEGLLVSGHRRLRAAQSLKLTEVQVRVFPSTDETEIKSALLAFNVHRIKTKRQLIGEGQLRLEIKRAQKRAQKAAKAKGEIMENFPTREKGATRDLVAKELGMSGRTLEKGIKTVEVIEKLRAEGKEDDAVLVENALEKSFDGGFAVAKSLGVIEENQRGRVTGNEDVAEVTPLRDGTLHIVTEPQVDVGDSSEANVLPFSKPIQDSDAAIEEADRLVSFLRSAEAKVLNAAQRRDLAQVLVQIVRLGKELGLVGTSEERAA